MVVGGLVGALAIGLAAVPALAAGWQLVQGVDPFSDLPVATAEVMSDHGDRLAITCDENKALVTVFSPAREIRAEEFEVRYRVDENPVVVSGLEWENVNGRARATLVSKTSLFGDRSQAEQVEEFQLLSQQLILGVRLVIEAGGELATFGLARSGMTLEAVLAACEVAQELEPPEPES